MKKVLITGGNGDIARAIYDDLKLDFDISIPSREELDVSNINSVEKYFKNNIFDIVVNSAGTLYSSLIAESVPELWIRDINVNLIGTYLISRKAIKNNPDVKIINISSTASFYSYKDWTSYCASKAGVNKISMGMVKDGYNVVVLCPGAIETKIRDGLSIVNNNIMSIPEGIIPIKDAILGVYNRGDVVYYRRGEIKMIAISDV